MSKEKMKTADLIPYREVNRTIIITPDKNIDESNSSIFQETLRKLFRDGYIRFVVDLSEVSYLASSAWGIIVAMTEQVAAKGGRLSLCNVGPGLRQII
ncbi:MAG: STAS domain-containing protein, partial [bacterium]|nr:STAS domain-containing protein [bacterium]